MEEYWNKFEQTGSIEDYLRYKDICKTIELENGGKDEACKGEGSSNKRDNL